MRRMRFGPYELDSAGRELRKNGLRLKISGQPLQVLGLLLERPGTAVTRREFFERLWAVDTFVDFDHSLNTAIKRLRAALDDDAEHPKYVETIPKYGYRFIGVVMPDAAKTETLTPPKPIVHAEPEPESGNVIGAPAQEAVRSSESWQVSRKRTWVILAGLAGLVVLGAVLASRRGPRVQAALTQKDSVLVADFRNTTGEPVFDGALENGLEIGLGQSPFLTIVSRDREREILRLMGR